MPIIRIGSQLEYNGEQWLVSSINKHQYVTLDSLDNPGRTTRVAFRVIERALDDARKAAAEEAAANAIAA